MYWKKNKKISMTLFTTAIIIISALSISTITLAEEQDSIIISEIMYNPQGSDSGREWIEVYNTIDEDINITNWYLFENNVNHSLNLVQGTDMIIPIKGFAVITNDEIGFFNDYPTYSGILIESSFSLTNTGEYIAIKNETYVTINDVTYSSQSGADDTNYTIEYNNDIWEVSTTYLGTPGEENSVWNAPIKPMNVAPADNEENVSINPQLEVFVHDPDNETMDIYFYDLENNEIGVDEDVESGENAIVIWEDLSYSTTYYWYAVAHDIYYETQSDVWSFTTMQDDNNPPNIPSSPDPSNGETEVPIDQALSWSGGDPDGDPVTYDVYFGTETTPEKVSSNQSLETYDPGELSNGTTYYWKIIAWDDKDASSEGPIWSFTTVNASLLSIVIDKPLGNKFYLRDREFPLLEGNSMVYGGITINVTVESTNPVVKVEFYIGEKLLGEDTDEPYSFYWTQILSGRKTIKVVVHDDTGDTAEDTVEVFKWRFHPVLVLTAAGIILNPNTKLLRTIKGYTVVRGIIFNPKQSGRTLTFRAVKLHYTKVKLLSTETGVIRFKKCTIQTALPDTQISLGPFGLFNWIFCTYRGTQLESPGLFPMDRNRGGLLRNLLNL